MKAETQEVLHRMPDRQLNGSREEQVNQLDHSIEELQAQAGKVTHLLEFVSLNMAALRKILKKFKKHIEPLAPMQGFLALEVSSVGGLALKGRLALNLFLFKSPPCVSYLLQSSQAISIFNLCTMHYIFQGSAYAEQFSIHTVTVLRVLRYTQRLLSMMQIDHPHEPNFHLSQVRMLLHSDSINLSLLSCT